jgi:predicted alpha/beta superfamily hydrolase
MGIISKFDVWFTPGGEKRRIHLYLPDGYNQTDERYPTLYFFDGHNLFFDSDATYGTCLGLKDFLDRWHKKLIVVGMEWSQDDYTRTVEYVPYDVTTRQYGAIHGRADATLNWLVNELKPSVDQNYRTMPFRETTSIGGYSMGGLTALYGVLRYNLYISKATIISPSLMVARKSFLRELDEHSYSPDTRIFFSWGTSEYDPETNWYLAEDILAVEKKSCEKGIKTNVLCQQGGRHNEASWREQTEQWMRFLWD